MHNFLCQNVQIFQNYILLEKSANFCLEASAVYVISSPYVLNCFKYFGAKCLKKSDEKNSKLYKGFMC